MTRKRVLAVASAGGHWKQLMQLKTLLSRYDVGYVTTLPGLIEESDVIGESYLVGDVNRKNLFKAARGVFTLFSIVIEYKPDVIVTTGAAPGLLAILIGRVLGVNTLWIDSIANGDQLSLSGKIAKRVASKTISQWKHVAAEEGVEYWGKVI